MNLPELRMNAYYFGFTPTGVRVVDEILSAVAQAGKGYHHTEGWEEPVDDDGASYADLIQRAAERAALVFRGGIPFALPDGRIIVLAADLAKDSLEINYELPSEGGARRFVKAVRMEDPNANS